jgi:hypothetical protein
MILKILLTLAVFIAVYIWFRKQNSNRLETSATVAARSVTVDTRKNNWIRPFSYSMAGLTLAAGILFYYLSWQEDHTQYQVTITNPQIGSSETFIALKKDMRGRLFITQSGREIRVSDLERIEVKKLTTQGH